MSLKNKLLVDPVFSYQNNIFYQNNFRLDSFEEAYLKLREKENRIYVDSVVKQLPEFRNNHPYKREWDMRKSTFNYLRNYLRKNGSTYIMELGCGNGWLAHNLAASLNAEICAVDVNETELLQGARVFKDIENLSFVYTDIFSSALKFQKFNAIVLAGSVQYFRDLRALILRLAEFTESQGKIYIADSPFYSSLSDALAARKRSVAHFTSLGFPEMADQYFHHTLNGLKDFDYKIVYNPRSILTLIKRKIFRRSISVFPILCINTKN